MNLCIMYLICDIKSVLSSYILHIYIDTREYQNVCHLKKYLSELNIKWILLVINNNWKKENDKG